MSTVSGSTVQVSGFSMPADQSALRNIAGFLFEWAMAHPVDQDLRVVVEVSNVVTIVQYPDERAEIDQLFANINDFKALISETRKMVEK